MTHPFQQIEGGQVSEERKLIGWTEMPLSFSKCYHFGWRLFHYGEVMEGVDEDDSNANVDSHVLGLSEGLVVRAKMMPSSNC